MNWWYNNFFFNKKIFYNEGFSSIIDIKAHEYCFKDYDNSVLIDTTWINIFYDKKTVPYKRLFITINRKMLPNEKLTDINFDGMTLLIKIKLLKNILE